MRLVLASASPRRKDLLTGLGVPFEVRPSRAPEDEPGRVPPAEAGGLALRLARRKAEAVAAELAGAPDVLVIGADTLVVLPDRILGKPASPEEAAAMLRALSGREHRVVTAVVVAEPATGRVEEGVEETKVFFRRLGPEDVRSYLATDEPFDKAGAYAIQGVGALLVERVEGCYFNVVGLPLGRLAEVLGRFGVNLLREAALAGKGGGGTRRDITGLTE
ncbi:MAG TPA: septum formation protein Maf [Clostridiales bacterium]|nr:septum formation protein Maf [Clostridiales bacterium]